jgi:hypothetical protein
MLPRSPRPRAADDFAVIRARLEALRRERAQLPADDEPHLAAGSGPYSLASRPELARKPKLSIVVPPLRRR